jgi:hypothetical protein
MWGKLNTYSGDILYSLTNNNYWFFPAIYIIYDSYKIAREINLFDSRFLKFIKGFYKRSYISKLYLSICVFGFFWFFHNNIEEILSKRKVVGEVVIVDSKKICDWHLSQLILRFSDYDYDGGEIIDEYGNGFDEIYSYTFESIRKGEYNAVYYIQFKPLEESITSSDSDGIYSDKSENAVKDIKNEPRSKFWKVHNGLFIEGKGDYLNKY